jgi:hypothetical protein
MLKSDKRRQRSGISSAILTAFSAGCQFRFVLNLNIVYEIYDDED